MVDIWRAADTSSAADRGHYIAISGNTGAGKSTLVRALGHALAAPGRSVITADERCFHHPLLPRMFADPKGFALPVQLNFLIQRGLFLLRALQNRHTVIVERSHYDDRLYVQDHVERGNISANHQRAYMDIAQWFDGSIPVPDLVILLDVSPSTSFRRVKRAEALSERPVEFPNDATLKSYIESWHERYQAFFKQLAEQSERNKRPRLARFAEEASTETILATVIDLIENEDALRN